MKHTWVDISPKATNDYVKLEFKKARVKTYRRIKFTVKLWDVDRTDADDLMDSGYTDANGDFHLSGWTKEYTTIDPKLAIYHE